MKLINKNKQLFGHLILAAVLLCLFVFNAFPLLEYRLSDFLFQHPTYVAPNIVVIGIDEQTLTELGRFQNWSRQIFADAINILNSDPDNKPAVIAIDILFIGESNDADADNALVDAAAAGGNVVLASQANLGLNMSLITTVLDYEIPFPKLSERVVFGFVNGTADEDSVIRNGALKIPYNGELIFSFPYEIYKKYIGEELNYAKTNNSVYIPYYGEPGDYSQGYSFFDIFTDDFDPDFFADSIVLIGPYASGLGDAYNTPVGGKTQMYGVEIHANVLQALLEKNFKQYAPFYVNFIILLTIVLISALLFKLDIRLTSALIAAMCAGYIGAALLVYNYGYILSLLYPLITLVFLYLYRLIYGYVMETLEKQRVKGIFKKYADPKLVDKLIDSGDANSDEVGVKKDIAVLFVDVRGFTPMTEALKDRPELIVKILNEYLELTSSCVFNNGGSVDKFIGDATMALFNGFVPLEDYRFKAVKAAWDIVTGAESVNMSIKEKYGVDVGFGVGVTCGDAIVGNLGPSFRKDYTAIGDTVNTAARLESNAGRSQVLISKNLYEMVKDRVEAVSIGEKPLKGKSEKLEVFSVTKIN